MSKETGSWSKFKFWLGVAAVGFIVMAVTVTPEGIVVGPLQLGYCFAVIFAMIAAVPASQPKSVVVSDVNMMPVMGDSEHQALTPDKLISRLTEKSTAQGMTNAAALRHGFGLGFAVGLAPILIWLGSFWVIVEGPWPRTIRQGLEVLVPEVLLVISIIPSIAVYFASEKRRLRTFEKRSLRMELGMLCGFFGGGGIIAFLLALYALGTIP